MLGVAIRRRVSLDPIPSGLGGGTDSAQLFCTLGMLYPRTVCSMVV